MTITISGGLTLAGGLTMAAVSGLTAGGGGGGDPPPSYAPSLDFSDDRNSQYWMFFI